MRRDTKPVARLVRKAARRADRLLLITVVCLACSNPTLTRCIGSTDPWRLGSVATQGCEGHDQYWPSAHALPQAALFHRAASSIPSELFPPSMTFSCASILETRRVLVSNGKRIIAYYMGDIYSSGREPPRASSFRRQRASRGRTALVPFLVHRAPFLAHLLDRPTPGSLVSLRCFVLLSQQVPPYGSEAARLSAIDVLCY